MSSMGASGGGAGDQESVCMGDPRDGSPGGLLVASGQRSGVARGAGSGVERADT